MFPETVLKESSGRNSGVAEGVLVDDRRSLSALHEQLRRDVSICNPAPDNAQSRLSKGRLSFQ